MAPFMKPRVPQPRGGRPGERRPLGPRPVSSFWYVLGFLLLLAIVQAYLFVPSARSIPYSDFKGLLAADKVTQVSISAQAIRGELKPDAARDEKSRSFTTTRVDDPKLVEELEQHKVKYSGELTSRWLPDLLSWIIPLLF